MVSKHGRRRGRALMLGLLAGTVGLLTPATDVASAADRQVPPGPGTIVVSPDTGLLDGQTVGVVGSGWVPGAELGFCQAVAVDPASPTNCADGAYTLLTADGAGGFSAPLTVYRFIYVPSLLRTVDCIVEACVVGAADSADLAGTVTTAPIAFFETGAPSAPGIGSAVGGPSQATVSWTAPLSSGGSPIVGYVVTPYVGFVSQGPRYFMSTATTQVITGLTNGTGYRFRVRAWNALGVSGFSTASSLVVPSLSAPASPTGPAAVAGDGQATVSWTAPTSDGGSPIVGYVVTPYVGYLSLGPRYFVSTATTQVITGLANGTTYRFRVRAWNAIGVSGFSGVTNAVIPSV